MKTITIKKVRVAYKNTGVNMIRCDTANENTCSVCEFGALYFNAHPQALATFKEGRGSFHGRRFEDVIIDWAKRKYKNLYSQGFMNGFDSSDGVCFSSTKDYVKGFKEGQDVQKALNPPLP